jgi:acetoin utilization protein AcuB
MKKNDQVFRWMTPCPQTIHANATVFDAFVTMRRFGIRHLPVIDDGQLVGILSDRDIALAERFVDPRTASVASVMTTDPYVVVPFTPLVEVAETMARHKYGSAIVIDNGNVVGVFTVVDALRAIAERATAPEDAASNELRS